MRNTKLESPLSTRFPQVSIIVTNYNEGEALKEHLPLLLSQQYPADFEVIVADMRSTDQSLSLVESMEYTYPNLRHTSCPSSAKDISISRLAMTLATKSADYEWLVFLKATSKPLSADWLQQLMQSVHENVDAVLALNVPTKRYNLHFLKPSFYYVFLATKTFLFAERHTPYSAECGYICYRKSHFMGHHGFASSQSLQIAPETLLLNHHIRPRKCAVNFNPRAALVNTEPIEKKWRTDHKISFETNRHLRYKRAYRFRYALDILSNFIFHLVLCFYLLVYIQPDKYQEWVGMYADIHINEEFFLLNLIIGLSLWALLSIIRMVGVSRITSQLKMPKMGLFTPFLILCVPLWDIKAWMAWLFSDKNVYRKKFI